MTHPAFISDALDDLRGVDLFAAPPVSAPSPNEPALLPAMRAMVATARRLAGVGDPAMVGPFGLDLGFLNACSSLAPDLFGDLLSWRLGVPQPSAAYQAAPGARNALRHTLHATGVL